MHCIEPVQTSILHTNDSSVIGMYQITIYRKMPMGETYYGFSLNRKYFPANHGFVDQQYKSKEMLTTAKVLPQIAFSTQNAKIFLCGCFSV